MTMSIAIVTLTHPCLRPAHATHVLGLDAEVVHNQAQQSRTNTEHSDV